ncbi:MAG TPA: type I polyketide synthase, partial [Candidatus Sulfopaludibacter sp.]|nr:type I polyketide synthase [Candidatus Sulfopaludibacter sp.]
VQQSLGRWPQRGRASLAGVNSFGFGGTNAHIIVEELPPASFLSGRATRGQAAGEAVGRPVLLPVSAQAGEELRQTAERYREFLDAAGAEKLEDICFTAGARHTHHEHRLVVMGRSPAELAGRLRQFRDGQSGLGVYSGQTQSGHGLKLAFVFPGQGQQWYAMGRQLVQREPVFRDTLHACDSLFRSWAPWSLMQELMSGEAESRLNQTEFAQPAVFSLQVALAELWRSWGLMPEAVIGHSMGEVAAAYFAGMLTLHDAACVIFHRARLMQRATGMGRMAAVRAPLERVERLIDPYRDVLSVAACNAPGINVISGDTGALERVLENAGPEVDYQYLPVRYAFHSPQMSGLQGEILDALQGLSPAAGETPMISTVTGEALSGVELDAPYWWSNVRRPVLFSAGIGKLLALGINAFVEISSHPTLLSAISECAAASGADVSLFPSLRRNADEQEQMLASLAALHIAGHEVQWRALYPRGVHTALPANVWDRQPFWHPGIARGGARAVLQTPAKHPLLGRRLDSATPVWECEYGVRRLPYLAEHRVQGKTVYPAAGYLETALAAFIEVAGRRRCVLSDVKFRRPLTLPESGIRRVETVVTLDGDAPETFRIYSFPGADDKAWTLHSEGRYEAAGEDAAPVEPDFPEAILRRSERSLTSAECYQRLAAMGLEYGDSFQGIDRIWIGPNEALARIRIPAAIQAGCAHYHVHPALLDACGQVLLASAERAGRAMIPAGVDRVRWYDAPVPDQEVWVHARIPSPDGMPTQRIAGDVWILDGSG